MTYKQKIALALGAMLSISSPVLAAVPLSLAESVEMALNRNEAVTIGKNDVDKAKWMLKYYRRNKGPKLSWSSSAARIGGKDYENYNYNHNRYGDKFGGPAYNNRFTNAFELSMPFYNLSMERQIKSGRFGLNAADLTLENTKQSLRYQVIKGYYDVLVRQNMINVAKSAAEMSADRLRMIRDQYEEGTVAKSDLLTMEVELANYQQQLNTAANEKKTAAETLNNLVGLPEGTEIETLDDLTYEPIPMTLDECLNYAFTHRPDQASAGYTVHRAEAELAMNKASNDPTLTGVASQNYSGNGGFQQNHGENWSIGVRLGWTIFDNAQNSARVHSSKADLESAKARLSQVERQVKLEVTNAYSQMTTAEKNLKIAKLSMEQAEENNSIAQVRYEEGVDTIINLTNAQEKLTRSRTNYYDALYSFNLGRAMLLKAMGVPVDLDAALYVAAVQEGKSSPEAVNAATTKEYYPLPQAPDEEAPAPSAKAAISPTAGDPAPQNTSEVAAEIAH